MSDANSARSLIFLSSTSQRHHDHSLSQTKLKPNNERLESDSVRRLKNSHHHIPPPDRCWSQVYRTGLRRPSNLSSSQKHVCNSTLYLYDDDATFNQVFGIQVPRNLNSLPNLGISDHQPDCRPD